MPGRQHGLRPRVAIAASQTQKVHVLADRHPERASVERDHGVAITGPEPDLGEGNQMTLGIIDRQSAILVEQPRAVVAVVGSDYREAGKQVCPNARGPMSKASRERVMRPI
jgi:hypothetical protein